MSVQTRKVKMTLNFLEGKPERYKLEQITEKPITFDQLVAECSHSCGVNPAMTKAVINALTDRLAHYMQIGHGVKMGEFGSFKPTFCSRTAKRLEDLDSSSIKRKVVRFFPGKAFRNMLADLSITSASEELDDPAIQATGGVGA